MSPFKNVFCACQPRDEKINFLISILHFLLFYIILRNQCAETLIFGIEIKEAEPHITVFINKFNPKIIVQQKRLGQ